MENMTSSLAKVLIVAALLRLLNIIDYTPIAQLGFTIAALLITIADVKQYHHDNINKNLNDINDKNEKIKKNQQAVNGYHLWAIFFLVAFPNIRFETISGWVLPDEKVTAMKEFFAWYMTNINDFGNLFALGLAIYTMSHKKNQRYLDTREMTSGFTVIDGNMSTGSRGDKDVK